MISTIEGNNGAATTSAGVTDLQRPSNERRHVAVVTSTRADWGLLSPVGKALRQRPDVKLTVIATNMHLDPLRGMTINEIEADGFVDIVRVAMPLSTDTPLGACRALATLTSRVADVLDRVKPDLLLILGDRFEMLAIASAATIFQIPIAHISGGELTEGAIDDNVRHALSKLSSLHFATTETHRQRLLAMGERPETVINAGALGVSNLTGEKLMTPEEMEASLGFKIGEKTLLVTFHPATNDPVDPRKRMKALLDALDRVKGADLLFTYPNNDPRSEGLIDMIEDFVTTRPSTAHAIPSLGRRRYLSALTMVAAVVGNSSSGVVEVPSAHIPTVNIGIRQRGRAAADSVIHCGDTADEIEAAITKALSPDFRLIAAKAENPYAKPATVATIVDKLCSVDIASLLPKKFHDISPLR